MMSFIRVIDIKKIANLTDEPNWDNKQYGPGQSIKCCHFTCLQNKDMLIIVHVICTVSIKNIHLFNCSLPFLALFMKS